MIPHLKKCLNRCFSKQYINAIKYIKHYYNSARHIILNAYEHLQMYSSLHGVGAIMHT